MSNVTGSALPSDGLPRKADRPPEISEIEGLYQDFHKLYWEFVVAVDDDPVYDAHMAVWNKLAAACPEQVDDCCVLLAFVRDILRRTQGDRFGNLPDGDWSRDADDIIARVQMLLSEFDVNRRLDTTRQRPAA